MTFNSGISGGGEMIDTSYRIPTPLIIFETRFILNTHFKFLSEDTNLHQTHCPTFPNVHKQSSGQI